jgi:hypothetical protein
VAEAVQAITVIAAVLGAVAWPVAFVAIVYMMTRRKP